MDLKLVDKEIQLVILLSKPTHSDDEIELIKNLLKSHMNWSTVIGLIQSHRLAGISWRNIVKNSISHGDEHSSFEELFIYLKTMHMVQYLKAQSQYQHLFNICETFEEKSIKYCILKGIVLSEYAYEDAGARSFNDTDILVHTNQLKEALDVLSDLGYIQGNIDYDTNTISPVSRKETLFWTMVSHEVHPHIKKIDEGGFQDFHIVDVQFSIDLNTGNRTDIEVDTLLSKAKFIYVNGKRIRSLCWEDMLIFVCNHFYKEAITYREVLSYSDLTLYKICDIANIISSKRMPINWEEFLNRVKELQMEKGVYYALHFCNEVFDNSVPAHVLDHLKSSDLEYLNEVYNYGSDMLAIRWEDTIIERIFNMNRPSSLKTRAN